MLALLQNKEEDMDHKFLKVKILKPNSLFLNVK